MKELNPTWEEEDARLAKKKKKKKTALFVEPESLFTSTRERAGSVFSKMGAFPSHCHICFFTISCNIMSYLGQSLHHPFGFLDKIFVHVCHQPHACCMTQLSRISLFVVVNKLCSFLILLSPPPNPEQNFFTATCCRNRTILILPRMWQTRFRTHTIQISSLFF
jgi:hypothetical protein